MSCLMPCNVKNLLNNICNIDLLWQAQGYVNIIVCVSDVPLSHKKEEEVCVEKSLVAKMDSKVEDLKGFTVKVVDDYSMPCKRSPRILFTLGEYEVCDDLYMIGIASTNLVLGVQWLHSLGELTLNYQSIELSFIDKGKKVIFQGMSLVTTQIKYLVEDVLSKESYLCSLPRITKNWKSLITIECNKNKLVNVVFEEGIVGERYKIMDGLILYKNGVYLVSESRVKNKILRVVHDAPLAGHPGYLKTHEKVRGRFFWKGLKEEVLQYIWECLACLQNRAEREFPAGLLQFLPISTQKGESISIVFITGLPTVQGKGCLYVVIDRLTKYSQFCRLAVKYNVGLAQHKYGGATSWLNIHARDRQQEYLEITYARCARRNSPSEVWFSGKRQSRAPKSLFWAGRIFGKRGFEVDHGILGSGRQVGILYVPSKVEKCSPEEKCAPFGEDFCSQEGEINAESFQFWRTGNCVITSPIIDLQEEQASGLSQLALAIMPREKLKDRKRKRVSRSNMAMPVHVNFGFNIKAPSGDLEIVNGTISLPEDVAAVIGKKFIVDVLLGCFATENGQGSASADYISRRIPLSIFLWSECTEAKAEGFLDPKKMKIQLINPIKVEMDLTPAVGRIYLGRISPLLGEILGPAVADQNMPDLIIYIMPLKMTLPAEHYRIHVEPMKAILAHGPLGGSILSLLSKGGKGIAPGQQEIEVETSAICADFDMGGSLTCSRFDLLLAGRVHLVTWGVIDWIGETLKMTIAIPGTTLHDVMDLSNLHENFYLKIPIKGTFDQPQVDWKIASINIAQLLLQERQGNFMKSILKEFTASEEPIPEPNSPFPWK
ncbi:hypothetical protein KI387_020147, partial [Taxus chinensis]